MKIINQDCLEAMKKMEESEKTIKLLRELNTEDVKSAKSISLLQTFINEVLESIKDIAEIVVEQDSNNGDYKSLIYQAKSSKAERNKGCEGLEDVVNHGHYAQDEWSRQNMGNTPDAVRKPTKNNHPTIKPIALMEYLINMVTPKGGIVLDPFMGSGSTGVAAIQNGFDFIGIDMTPEYIEIAKARLTNIENNSIL